MPTLFARRYMRKIKQVGGTEKALGGFILLLVAAVVVAFAVQVSTNKEYLFGVDEKAYVPARPERDGPEAESARAATAERENPFPDPGLEGWSGPRQVERFVRDNLYIKIDGRAAAYLEYGTVELTFGTYCHQSAADRMVDVYWYDMGQPADALGMFRAEQPPDASPLAIGGAGYQVGGAVFFCKGSSYVQVIPTRLDDADARAALKIAECVAERIGG